MSDCPCGYPPAWSFADGIGVDDCASAAWHRRHRDHHLTVFPDVDDGTRRTLDDLVERAEFIEVAP